MDSRISKVLDYIEGHLSTKPVLKNLAEIACMSPGHFHRAFKKETGRTPFAFIEEIKMNKAYQMLMAGSVKVHELSEQLGYRDYETFSRAFKKHHTLAPDDLKAIVQKIKSAMNVSHDSIIIKTFQVENISEIKATLDQVSDKLKQLLIEKGYSEEDIKKAKVMSVIPKIEDTDNEQDLVKNKFVITENRKIWRDLLNQT